MSDGPDRERARILDSVRTGKMTPAQAEIWAKANGREPFEKRPDVSALDPMKEELWTLPMAAAWFIWHSPHAVRDQWNLARKSWTKWIRLADQLPTVPPRPSRRLWDLKLFRRANLDDVFAQAGLNPWRNSQKELQFGFGRRSAGRGSNRKVDNPYDRFKASLQSGKLIAIHMRPGEKEAAQIPAEYWIEKFEEFEDPLGFDLPESSSTSDAPSEKPFESPLAVDLSEHFELGIERLEVPESFFGDPPEGAIYVSRASTTQAEKEVAHRDFRRPDWGLEQALGWLAYRNENDFRSLGRAELKPPTYYGEAYPPDFANPHPEEALREALINGVLKGYLQGNEVAQAKWLDMAVWGAPGVKFRRDEVLLIGFDSKTQPPVMKILPADAAPMLAPSNNLDVPGPRIDNAVAEGGRQPGGRKFERARRVIEEEWPTGVPDQVSLVARVLESVAVF